MTTIFPNQISHDSQDTGQKSRHKDRHSNKAIVPIVNFVKPGNQLIIAHDPYDPHCEEVRALRTELLLRRESDHSADIIALLSPCAGEGRSLLAAELAIAFAQLGRPTLLVDADLRHPQQHSLFDTDNRLGLAQVIEHGIEPPLHTVHGLQHMSLLTAGAVCSNPLELLSSNRFARLIDEWRQTYEFVIIDTAPVMQYSDGLAVASMVGRVLALTRAQHTPYKEMQDMLRRLSATRSQMLGAVISHF